jgi:hypothetical protein
MKKAIILSFLVCDFFFLEGRPVSGVVRKFKCLLKKCSLSAHAGKGLSAVLTGHETIHVEVKFYCSSRQNSLLLKQQLLHYTFTCEALITLLQT